MRVCCCLRTRPTEADTAAADRDKADDDDDGEVPVTTRDAADAEGVVDEDVDVVVLPVLEAVADLAPVSLLPKPSTSGCWTKARYRSGSEACTVRRRSEKRRGSGATGGGGAAIPSLPSGFADVASICRSRLLTCRCTCSSSLRVI